MWLTICQRQVGVGWYYVFSMYVTLLFLCCPVCRCQRPLCRAVSGVGRHLCTPTPWHSTSNRSPWPTGSPLRRLNSSSFQVSQANSILITLSQTETGRLFKATVLAIAPVAPPPAKRMVCISIVAQKHLAASMSNLGTPLPISSSYKTYSITIL